MEKQKAIESALQIDEVGEGRFEKKPAQRVCQGQHGQAHQSGPAIPYSP